MALNTADLQFAEDGFLAVNITGGTTSGSVILGVTDYSLAYTNDNLEILHIEDNFNKSFVNTSSSWTMSASYSVVASTGSTAIDAAKWSADTKLMSGTNKTKNALDLLEVAKTKNLTVGIIMRLKSGNYQVGKAIITSVNIDSSVGAVKTGSIEFQGVGALTKATS